MVFQFSSGFSIETASKKPTETTVKSIRRPALPWRLPLGEAEAATEGGAGVGFLAGHWEADRERSCPETHGKMG